MRSLNELINSGKPLNRKERARVEEHLWLTSDVLSLGREHSHLKGEARKEKVKWYKTWSNKE
tara:strand:+ start:347 stop:532 length:186 start_codon:yes stop_codon:yes gene_type:complete